MHGIQLQQQEEEEEEFCVVWWCPSRLVSSCGPPLRSLLVVVLLLAAAAACSSTSRRRSFSYGPLQERCECQNSCHHLLVYFLLRIAVSYEVIVIHRHARGVKSHKKSLVCVSANKNLPPPSLLIIIIIIARL